MIYRIYLILFIIIMLICPTAFGDEERFRIELLVLKHLDGFSKLDQEENLRNFSEAMDLLLPPENDVAAESDTPPEEALPEENQIEEDQVEEGLLEEEPTLPAAVLVETRGDEMQQAWRRLRLSAPFRPEQYLSWEQSSEEPYPLIRVHDLELLYEEDPYADLRDPEDDDSEQVTVFSDVVEVIDSEEEPESEEEALPPPNRYYRIDGTARFIKTRFLHLDLDIEFRVPLFSQDAMLETPEDTEEPTRPSSFKVHRLKQSRQVRTQEMQYFDGPVISVLAFITRVEIPPEESEGSVPPGP